MYDSLSTRHAWLITAVLMIALAAWFLWTVFVWRLPIHPWTTIAVAIAAFTTLFVWSGTDAATWKRVERSIFVWNVSILVALIVATIFGGAGQPFPKFALAIVVLPTIAAAGAIVVFGLVNLCRTIIDLQQRRVRET